MPMIVDSVLRDENGSDQSTELDQRMPVAPVARETRGFNRKHGADTALTDCRQQALEARACDTAARATEIIVNDLDSGPAKLFGAIGEPVLAAPALMIVCQLIGCRLTDVDTGAACKMLSRDLGHDCSPPLQAPLRSRATGPPPVATDWSFARPPGRCVVSPPRKGSAGDFRIGASLSASSVFDSDRRKPNSASTSVRRDRKISRGKRGLSLISKCDAASCVIQTGRQASELSGCRITTNWTPLRSSRRMMTTVSL